MTLPIERYKEGYANWRYNPFTDESLAVDKEEDNLYIPASSPYQIQILELPRKDVPSTVTVYCYDTAGYFTEVAVAPAQGEFQVDYPPTDGKGTGLIRFSQNDAGKQVKINYKATGSPILEEFLNTKLSWPAGTPTERQIVAIVSDTPVWRNNPVRYFHEGNAVYNAAGESESCVLFRFKKSSSEGAVLLELKGAKLHQAYYSELAQHLHAVGTLAGTQPTHQHAVGTLAGAQATHVHGNGTLAGTHAAHYHLATYITGSQPTHVHAQGSLAGTQATHIHGNGTLGGPLHDHSKGTLAGTQPTHQHGVGTLANANQDLGHHHQAAAGSADTTGALGFHSHAISGSVAAGGDNAITISGETAQDGDGALAGAMAAGGNEAVAISGNTSAGGNEAITIGGSTDYASTNVVAISGAMAAGGNEAVTISGNVAAGGNDAVTIAGSTANAGVIAKTYPNAFKVYVDNVDKTSNILSKSGLGALGDGTSGHAFVTTGTGEMNITDLITSDGFHEIKITEPQNAGGRVLIHMELY